MEQVSTIEYYQVVRKIANGNEADAKVLTDYVEQTKQTNYTTLKDVFMTKDDKNTILERIDKIKSTLQTVLISGIALLLTAIGIATAIIVNYKK